MSATTNTALGAIKQLFKTTKLTNCSDGVLIIQESDRSATLKKIQLLNGGVGMFAIKFDESGFPSRDLFSDAFGLHRACDAIVFCEVNNKPHILCIELKSAMPTREKIAEQFRNTRCFLKYLAELLSVYRISESIENWSCQYFVFHNQQPIPLSVRPVSRRITNPDNLTPETARFESSTNGQRFDLRHLLRIAI